MTFYIALFYVATPLVRLSPHILKGLATPLLDTVASVSITRQQQLLYKIGGKLAALRSSVTPPA